MSTTTLGTAPFCTRVLALSYLKFEFMILHQLIVNLFEKRIGAHGEKKQIFVLNLICKHTTTMKTMVWPWNSYSWARLHRFENNLPVFDFWGFERFLQFCESNQPQLRDNLNPI